MTRSVETKIIAIEKPFSITVALSALAIMGSFYAMFISSAVESAARADVMREKIADLYTDIASLESLYAENTETLNTNNANMFGFTEPKSISYVPIKSSGLSFADPIGR
jgi:hypothetical protein